MTWESENPYIHNLKNGEYSAQLTKCYTKIKAKSQNSEILVSDASILINISLTTQQCTVRHGDHG